MALVLPASALSANASQARVVVAGLEPVATKDVVVNKVITTSFDLAFTQRHQGALNTLLADLTTRRQPLHTS